MATLTEIAEKHRYGYIINRQDCYLVGRIRDANVLSFQDGVLKDCRVNNQITHTLNIPMAGGKNEWVVCDKYGN